MEVKQANTTANTTPPTATYENVQKEVEMSEQNRKQKEQVEKTVPADANTQLGTNVDTYA